MALQGTIETFALPDVLRLLGSSKKSGRLLLSGGRGSGSVWVDAGEVIATEATGAVDGGPVDVLFELLRFRDGSFTFEADEVPSDPGEGQDVEPLLIEAEGRLAEWVLIEAVVPSLDVVVALREQSPGSDVVLEADRWRTIVAVGSGATVRAVAEDLGLDEVSACRIVKELVEQGLLDVVDAAEPVAEVDVPVEDVADLAATVDSPIVAEAQPDPLAPADAFADLSPAPEGVPSGDLFADLSPEPEAGVPSGDLFADVSPTPDGATSSEPEPDVVEEPSARAELDAMASGFGLEDTGSFFDAPASDAAADPTPAFDSPSGEAFAFGPPAETTEQDGTDFGGLPPAPYYQEPVIAPPGSEPLFADDVGAIGPPPPPPAPPGPEPVDPLFAPDTAPAAQVETRPGDAAEVARQLANLSPKAARAVAAAARASTVEEREAALAEVTADGDEPINRGLLLKFLSSVQS